MISSEISVVLQHHGTMSAQTEGPSVTIRIVMLTKSHMSRDYQWIGPHFDGLVFVETQHPSDSFSSSIITGPPVVMQS